MVLSDEMAVDFFLCSPKNFFKDGGFCFFVFAFRFLLLLREYSGKCVPIETSLIYSPHR